ncbi:MAG: DUF1911 domain-containing protein [bacterium]
MRDKNKSKEYFEKYIEDKTILLNELVDILLKEGEAKSGPTTPAASKVFHCALEFFNAIFSVGECKETLQQCYNLILMPLKFIHVIEYRDVLNILSIGILLDINPMGDIKHLLDVHMDDFLGLLTEYFTKEPTFGIDQEIDFPYITLYLQMALVESPEEALEILVDYLLIDWYDSQSHEYWHGNEDTENYFGYWCFEAMALAKINKVDTTKLETIKYFSII